MKTTNIPESLPIKVDPKTEREIKAWMAEQEIDPNNDDCCQKACRWKYEIVDLQIWSDITVTDSYSHNTFKPEMNPEEF